MASDKIIDRIEKLLRMAAPDSSAAEQERITASCEAVRLIIEHSISMREPPPSRRTSDWVLNLAPYHAGCARCGGKISPRDAVWIRVDKGSMQIQFRHNYGDCAVP